MNILRHVRNELELIAVARALIGPGVRLSRAEAKLVRSAPIPDASLVKRTRAAILADKDPLGQAFTAIRSPQQRRKQGATYTPPRIVRAMVRWAQSEATPSRIVDPGAGSGRYLIAAARVFPQARLVGIEVDPLAALILRANFRVLRLDRRTTILVDDYRRARLPKATGRTLFIGNPPYVRHHDIPQHWKQWYRQCAHAVGIKASNLAGLHLHFFFRTMELARSGDFGAFITSSEWMDVNYGSALRELLADGLGGVSLQVIDPTAFPFDDAATTGAITCFRVGARPDQLRVRLIAQTNRLGTLAGGQLIPWAQIRPLKRWSVLVRQAKVAPSGYIELGEICRVHRGQVTGANSVWIAGEHSNDLPTSVLRPTVTKARDLLNAGDVITNANLLRKVIDLPAELESLEEPDRPAVKRFLAWARAQGAHDSYIAKHRRAWWAVNLRAPAPIMCTYMARRAPAFVRNLCGARHINIAHGLYPNEALPDDVLTALAAWLRENVHTDDGRTYAGGLTKFEPRELERVLIPLPDTLLA